MMLTLNQFLELRAKAPAKLTSEEAQAIKDAADWGIIQSPKVDAPPTAAFQEIFDQWTNANPNIRKVWDHYGNWAIGSVSGSSGLVRKALEEAAVKPVAAA